MSGNNIARKVHRSLLRRGKITPEAYARLHRNVCQDAASLRQIEDNERIREAAKFLRQGDPPLYLVEIIYHPTKGYRVRRGEDA